MHSLTHNAQVSGLPHLISPGSPPSLQGLGAGRFDWTLIARLLVSLHSYMGTPPLTPPSRTLRPAGRGQCSLCLRPSAQTRSTICCDGNCQEAGHFQDVCERLGVSSCGWMMDDCAQDQGQTRLVEFTWLTGLGGAKTVNLIQKHTERLVHFWSLYKLLNLQSFPIPCHVSLCVLWCMNVITCYLLTQDRKLKFIFILPSLSYLGPTSLISSHWLSLLNMIFSKAFCFSPFPLPLSDSEIRPQFW